MKRFFVEQCCKFITNIGWAGFCLSEDAESVAAHKKASGYLPTSPTAIIARMDGGVA